MEQAPAAPRTPSQDGNTDTSRSRLTSSWRHRTRYLWKRIATEDESSLNEWVNNSNTPNTKNTTNQQFITWTWQSKGWWEVRWLWGGMQQWPTYESTPEVVPSVMELLLSLTSHSQLKEQEQMTTRTSKHYVHEVNMLSCYNNYYFNQFNSRWISANSKSYRTYRCRAEGCFSLRQKSATMHRTC